jgi:hypothetical protein
LPVVNPGKLAAKGLLLNVRFSVIDCITDERMYKRQQLKDHHGERVCVTQAGGHGMAPQNLGRAESRRVDRPELRIARITEIVCVDQERAVLLDVPRHIDIIGRDVAVAKSLRVQQRQAVRGSGDHGEASLQPSGVVIPTGDRLCA